MKRILATGLLVPMLINAQGQLPEPPSVATDDDPLVHDGLEAARSTKTLTVTKLREPYTWDPKVHTAGLVPIPVAHTARQTSVQTASVSTTTIPAVIIPASGAAEITVTTRLLTLGHTITIGAQPTDVPSYLADEKNAWRFNTSAPHCTALWPTHKNRTDCAINRCMWDYTKPLNITRVWPAVQFPIEWTNATSPLGSADTIDSRFGKGDYREFWVNERTLLSSQVHWGTTTDGIYYPHRTVISSAMLPASTIKVGKATITLLPRPGTEGKIERVFPEGQTPGKDIRSAPLCSNFDECAEKCSVDLLKRERHHAKMRLGLIVAASVLAGLIVLLFAMCCCRRRRDRHSRANPTTTTVTQTTAGQPNGTLGRQAEEGRGRVHFPGDAGEKAATGSAAGTAAGATTEHAGDTAKKIDAPAAATEKTVTAPAKHVETIPAHDGADSWPTGSLRHEMGSMRGRKKMRADLRNLF